MSTLVHLFTSPHNVYLRTSDDCFLSRISLSCSAFEWQADDFECVQLHGIMRRVFILMHSGELKGDLKGSPDLCAAWALRKVCVCVGGEVGCQQPRILLQCPA